MRGRSRGGGSVGVVVVGLNEHASDERSDQIIMSFPNRFDRLLSWCFNTSMDHNRHFVVSCLFVSSCLLLLDDQLSFVFCSFVGEGRSHLAEISVGR
jgi:hypothetical protein